MQTISHREYLTRTAWLEEEWDRPSRGDNYLMMVAAEVRRQGRKDPNSVKPEHFKLKFEHAKPEVPPTAKEITRRAQARHLAAVGGAKVVRVVKKS